MKHFLTYDGHDANILKFDEELETPRSTIVENNNNNNNNYSNVCSTIRKPSRHKQTSEIETGNFSGWKTEKEESVVIPEELEQKFETKLSWKQIILFLRNPKFRVTKYNHLVCNQVTRRPCWGSIQ